MSALLILAPGMLPAPAHSVAFAQFGLPPLPPPPPSYLDKLDVVLLGAISNLSGQSPVIVRVADGAPLAPIAALIQLLGGVPGRNLPILNAVAATMPHTAILALIPNADVQRVVLDRPTFGSLDRTTSTVGSAAVRAATGYDGQGIGVAVIDSGIVQWHDDLTEGAPGGNQRVRQFVDFVSGASMPHDNYGHGSHVAGIIAGNGFDSGGARAGVAPAAHLVVLKVLDQQGHGRISDVIAALDYVATHKDTFAIRVVNMSIGAAVHESFDTDLLTLAAKRVVELGVVVVAAAGNAGTTSDGRIVYGGIGAPANAPWVLTVGAASHMGTVERTDDVVARFSSRGPTVVDRLAKPDLVAPGVGIVSLTDELSWLHQARPQSRIAGTVQTPQFPYLSLSGTSQAAPVVSGTVALMLHANPILTPNAVKAILEYTAENGGAHDPLTQGAGFLNAQGAVELARYFGQPSGTLPDSALWSKQILWGNHRLHGGQLTPDANAWSSAVVWGADTHPTSQPITWGLVCPEGTNCDVTGWSSWSTVCSDTECTNAAWNTSSQNVVWGSSCGGSDCATSTWSTSQDDDTVVWGNSGDDDTVVWGNSDDDDTVVWGNSGDDDTVVWGNSCQEPECEL